MEIWWWNIADAVGQQFSARLRFMVVVIAGVQFCWIQLLFSFFGGCLFPYKLFEWSWGTVNFKSGDNKILLVSMSGQDGWIIFALQTTQINKNKS